MIAETGHFALVLALMVALVQATVPMIGAHRGNALMMAMDKPSSYSQVLLVAFAFGCLTYSHVTSDFSVLNVVQNSHSKMPMLYKVSAVWGNHEGSLLLWVLILSLFGSAVALFGGNLPPTLRARVLGVQAMIAVGFYLFMLLTSNPFLRQFPIPLDGKEMNPLLQDPGLAFHPPFLYLGYVGFSMAFSFAIAALIEGRVDAAWARWVRPWTLAAWTFLTIGVALGSWWAYYELGWGGWWFWDPVENASFMPWLAGTALLHSAIVVEKRDTMKAWTIFLAILAFSLSLLGTFLVRSGVLTSVHAFATDPERGVFILMLLLIVIGGSLVLFAIRAPALKSTGVFKPISREGGLLLNNLVMSTGAAVVLLGTLYPLFLDAVGGGKVSVGPPFFNSVFIPLMLPMLFAMGFGPVLAWKRTDMVEAAKRLKLAFIATGLVLAAMLAIAFDGPFMGIVGITIATWVFMATAVELAERIKLFSAPRQALSRLLRQQRASWGMTLAHMGLAIAIAGMAGAGGWKVEKIQTMVPGQSVNLAGYDFKFMGARRAQGPNYTIVEGTFQVSEDGNPVVTLHPEKRNYPVRQMPTTEAAIHTLFMGDLYAVIGDPEGSEGGFVTRLYYNPLIAWMWFGAFVMVFGSVISISDRRYRVGAPKGHASGKQVGAKV